MATVRFTQNIQRHVACPTRETAGANLRAVLDDYFSGNPRARGYVLDEQGKLRQHMVVFIVDVKPSVFGFAVAVHPKDPNTAWFVPSQKDEKRCPIDGRVVVNRTRDGGKSFETLRRGLPQVHAYDLVYRHGLDVDATGDRLVFGSTTGSVWVSENGGDSWQTVATNLPPVYSVRFA